MKKISSLIGLIVSTQLFGWGELGHKTTAEVSYRFLTPKAKQMIVEILGPNTHITGAVFPDDVRSDKRFDAFKNYHFLEILPGKGVSETLEENKAKKTADSFVAHPELLYGEFTRNQKMLALQYLIHIIGDVHQPLHVGNGIDMGANLCAVKWVDPETGKASESNLHSVWDDKIFDIARKNFKTAKCQKDPDNKIKYYDYNEIVACVMNDYEVLSQGEKDKLLVLSKEPRAKWYEESQKLHAEVYPDKEPVTKPEDRAYCKTVNGSGNFDPNKIPTLDESYGKKAFEVAKKQLLVGGMRLAKYLNDAAEKYPKLTVPPKDGLESLLSSLEPEKLAGRGTSSVKKKAKNNPGK